MATPTLLSSASNTIRQVSKFWTSKKPGRFHKIVGLMALSLATGVFALGITSTLLPESIKASDHDDGDIDVRSRALSLTDLYAFREVDQNPAAQDSDLILVMNTNPRSVARQQYYFSTEARYEFRISRVSNVNGTPTARPDLTLRFTFGEPSGPNLTQPINMTVIDGRGTTTVSRGANNRPLRTTTLGIANNPIVNDVAVRGSRLSVFAGLREDPFFFDVEQFFRVRAGLAGLGPAVGFRDPDKAQDFAKGYNVNAIVVRVPRRLLQAGTDTTAFDVWLSLNIRDPRTGQFFQTEQLARPAVNEGLVIAQDNLAAYNRVQPTRQVTPALRRVAAEAKSVLLALGNSNTRADALLGAFLPDVMRIDTTGPSGYANALNTKGAPIRGRMLLDDVIDITLAVLSNGAVTTDNVSYEGTPGNPGQGHQPLATSFPYLAPPN
jgi:Domain of unknown function (DUF4331)